MSTPGKRRSEVQDIDFDAQADGLKAAVFGALDHNLVRNDPVNVLRTVRCYLQHAHYQTEDYQEHASRSLNTDDVEPEEKEERSTKKKKAGTSPASIAMNQTGGNSFSFGSNDNSPKPADNKSGFSFGTSSTQNGGYNFAFKSNSSPAEKSGDKQPGNNSTNDIEDNVDDNEASTDHSKDAIFKDENDALWNNISLVGPVKVYKKDASNTWQSKCKGMLRIDQLRSDEKVHRLLIRDKSGLKINLNMSISKYSSISINVIPAKDNTKARSAIMFTGGDAETGNELVQLLANQSNGEEIHKIVKNIIEGLK